MPDPSGKSDPGPPPGSLRKRPAETHSAEYSTTPQVPVQEPLDPFPGRIFGDYEILERIARGGMGVVYKARQISLNRLVALKIIPGSELANPVERQRFRIEVEAAASIDHPRIVPIYEVGEHDGYYFYSMRLIEGGNLAQHMARYRDDHRAAARLIISAARGIHYAHQRGILHRDLKPANILLDKDGRPHVADFGVAKNLRGEVTTDSREASPPHSAASAPRDASADPAADSQRSRPGSRELDLTQVGEIVGTPSYMAPEQASGKKGVVTVAADIYSLGAILYEMLTGRPPFKGPTRMATVRQVLTERPIPPRQLNPRIDRDLESICLKCLEREPQNRYPSAEALAEDLERWLAGEPILAAPRPWWYRTLKWVKRRPTMAALVTATAIVTGLGLAGVTWQARLAHSQAERAWSAELALLREREQLRQARARQQRQQTLRQVQDAFHSFQQGDYRSAVTLLEQIPVEQRRWEWRLLQARLQLIQQPSWQHPPVLALTQWEDGWAGLTADGQVIFLRRTEAASVTARTLYKVPFGRDGLQSGSAGLLSVGQRLLAVWGGGRASGLAGDSPVPFWTWEGQAETLFGVRLDAERKTIAVIYRPNATASWQIGLFPEPNAFPRTISLTAEELRACEFVGSDHLLALTATGKLYVWPLNRDDSSHGVLEARAEQTDYWLAQLPAPIQRAVINRRGYLLLVQPDRSWRTGRWQPGWDRLWLEDPQTLPEPAKACALSDDGSMVALAAEDGAVYYQRKGSPLCRWQLPRKLSIVDMHFAAGLDELACRTSRGEVFLIPVTLARRIVHRAVADSPAPPQRKHSPAIGDFTWPADRHVIRTVTAPAIGKVCALTKDRKLLTGTLPAGSDREVQDCEECSLAGKTPTSLAWCDSRKVLLVACAENTLMLGKFASDGSTWTWQEIACASPILHLAASADGEWFATADATGQVMLWDTELASPVLSAAILPTGCKELVATDQGLHCVDGAGVVWFWSIPPPSASDKP